MGITGPFDLMSDRDMNILRGKSLVQPLTRDEIDKVFTHIDALHYALDNDADDADVFGSEGWRRYFGHPDAD